MFCFFCATQKTFLIGYFSKWNEELREEQSELDRVVWWSVLHLIKSSLDPTFLSAWVNLAWKKSEDRITLMFPRDSFCLLRIEQWGGVEKIKKKKLGHYFHYKISSSPPHCCWAALDPPLLCKNCWFLLAQSRWHTAGVQSLVIGWIRKPRMGLGGTGRRWGCGLRGVQSRGDAPFPLSYYGALERAFGGEGTSVYECGIRNRKNVNIAWSVLREEKVIGWEKKQRKMMVKKMGVW